MPRDINTLSAEKISSTVSHCFHNLRISLLARAGRRTARAGYGALMIVALACLALNGCGSGGYAGGGITSLSSSAVTIDAGQSFQLEAAVSGNALVSWSMAGSCSGAACGALSNATGITTTYTAPAGIASQMKLTVNAAIDGTASSKVVTITVNPDPEISGTPPAGTVGTPYTATLKATGGTTPLTFTTVGSLPAGLTFNATTGVISGTPTKAGVFSFSAQIVDSSDVPFTLKSAESISISTAIAPLTIAGNPPAGTVGVPYTTSLIASGGTAPYDFSLTAGSLPAGLEISATTGAITGTPTAPGTSAFTAQAADALSSKASAGFSIQINSAGSGQTLALSLLPGATVGVPYNATIGVTGGTAPYTCIETAGALPAGLTLSTSCVVSGTPTIAGTSNLTVKATDSSSPALTVTGPETIVVSSVGGLALNSPPNATVGTPYSGMIGVTGGTAPYSCVLVAGPLPPGLTLGSGCLITGTPTASGTWDLTVTATDSSSPMKTITGPVSLTVLPSTLTLTLSTLPGATVGIPYTATIGVSGGTAPYSCLETGGALPAGLTLSASCVVSGTPTTAGTSTVTVKATDSTTPAETVTGPESITVAAAPVLVLSNPPGATVNTPYTGTIGVTGGTAPYVCVLVSGTLPAGLTLGTNCVFTGTPTTPVTYPVTVKATDTSTPVRTSTSVVTVVVSPAALTLTLPTLPGATVGVPYTAAIGVSGGVAPYTCTQVGGTLPPGLTMSASCVVSGTPTTAGGPYTFQVMASDSSSPAETVTGPESITVAAAPVLILSNPPGATVNTPYSGAIGVTGGTAPYTCTLITGPLPAGLTLGTNCIITGTPTAPGTYPVTVKATDTSTPVRTGTSGVTVVVSPAPLTLTLATLPAATVGIPYTATIGVSGGVAPYTCTQAGGTLPPGLTMSTSCVVSGTPTTAGPYTVQVMATDSSNPAETVTGPESITVSAATNLVLSNPPGATVNTPYTGMIGVAGGTAPYTCTLITGPLPVGLTLGTNCVITGTPTAPGSFPITVKATDSGTPAKTITGPVTVTVSPTPLTITVSNLPNGTVGTPYSATIGVSGGTAPYSCAITAGTLPAGLSLGAGCVVSGTPTVADSVILSVKATDSSSPVESTTGPVGLTILPANITLTLSNPPAATVNVPYTGTIGVSGGKAPYSCTITLGTLPAGLTLGAGCVITGTPTTATPPTTVVTVKATDSSNPVATTTGPVTVTVLPATATLTLSNPPAATVGVPYTGTIGVSGGTAPYSCTLITGTLPGGLTLGAACAVTGTPTAAGTFNVTIHATDSATPTADQVTGPVTFTVNPVPPLSLTGSLPNATLGVPYTQTLAATGGIPPYTYALTAGSLPPGLTLSSTGTISGTPTAVGASSFTVTATDHETTPQTASLPLVLLVVYPTTPNDSELIGPYAFLFQGYDDVVAGVLAYQTATVASFTADGTGVISSGELDSNHQYSNPTGNTVSSHSFLGSYTLGTDNRGLITITTLNADGTTGATTTYAITAKAPVSPATVITQASLIEFDDNQLVGTRGSGTMLAQQSTSFSAGLQGSYAFGMSGDTPCLPSCTIGIAAGPVASVGEFTTDGSSLLTGGTSDANIASTNYAEAPLTGDYTAADGNGRLALTMDTAGTPVGIYPTDYAVYLVSANQAFVMSTDKHSAYLLLAGTAQLKTQPTFSNASMDAAIVGYENAQSNPGLLGVTLQNVLNLSSATIFRAKGNGAGHCDFTSVDVAGLTGLVNQLTGLGSSSALLNALLGTYQSTGTSVCTVASSGRGVLEYPNPDTLLTLLLQSLGLSTGPPAPREFYLVSPSSGYFLETGYAGLGRFEPQTGTPSTLASLHGTYVYASLPAASLASINSSGILVANGTGSATTTLDLNVGVGTINVLEVGATSTSTYTLSNAADGRFVLGASTVIYEIAPGRFVLVDTSALTTSPTVTLLY
jgi:large repetitive protein